MCGVFIYGTPVGRKFAPPAACIPATAEYHENRPPPRNLFHANPCIGPMSSGARGAARPGPVRGRPPARAGPHAQAPLAHARRDVQRQRRLGRGRRPARASGRRNGGGDLRHVGQSLVPGRGGSVWRAGQEDAARPRRPAGAGRPRHPCPVGVHGLLQGPPQRQRIQEAKRVDPPAPLDLSDPPLPCDASDGGCDSDQPAKEYKAWTREHRPSRSPTAT